MANRAVTFEGFGGLDLVTDPAEVGPQKAIDGIDFDLDDRGQLRVRDGAYIWTTSQANSDYDFLFQTYGSTGGSGLYGLIAGNGTTVRFINSAGALSTSTTWANANARTTSAVRFGTPTAERVYVGCGLPATFAAVNVVKRWDGAAWTDLTGIVDGMFLARKDPDNRLVSCNTSSGKSRVFFSDAGAPETWTAANYVELSPGDGSPIMGACNYRDSVFVFKNNKFFVF